MRRFLPDTFTMLLVLTVVTASFLPVHGASAHYFSIATNFAIGLLFFLHGARLSRDVVIAGLLHWRLHLVILLTTFGIFPLLVLAIGQVVPNSILPVSLYTGMLFLSVLPSTVQSSIAFTSIAGGNVPAAICSASASNIFGMFLTPLLVGLLFSVGGQGGFSWDVLWQIMLQLLAPFIAGQ
jgi:sodium/bile acid cotransporter 7